jgi:hypothetical protein
VEAFPNKSLTGTVEDVAPLPDPAPPGTRAKVYTTHIKLEQRDPAFRPGMVAEAVVIIAELADAISVPVGAVVPYDGKDHVAVRGPDNQVEWREVTLGVSNETRVQVKQGLRAGESVILDPHAMLNAGDRRGRPARPTPPAATPAGPR